MWRREISTVSATVLLGTYCDVSLVFICCPFVKENFPLFLVDIAVFKFNVRSCEFLSFELGGGCSDHSCLVSVLYVVLLKCEGLLYGNVLCLPDAVLWTPITTSAQGAFQGGHLA